MGEGRATGDGLCKIPSPPQTPPVYGRGLQFVERYPYSPTRFANHRAAASGLSFAASSRSTR